MYSRKNILTAVSLALLLFSFIGATSLIGLVHASSIIVNGGFETGDMTGWAGIQAAVTEGFGHTGTHSLVIMEGAGAWQDFDPPVSLVDCELTFWYQSGYGLSINLIIAYSTGSSESFGPVVGAMDWQQATFPIDSTREMSRISFITPEAPDPNWLCAIDDVDVICEPTANLPPVADANGPYAGTVGVPTTLDGSGSVDPDGTIVAYEWDLDNDGEFDDAVGENPSCTFGSEGTFDVSLRVTDDDGETDTDSTTITVTSAPVPQPEPPTASFTESPHIAPVNTPITFDPSGSSDSDGTIVLYEWDWDSDGVYDEAYTTPDIVTHSYTTAGTYTVTLRVTDDDGLTDTATDTKTITQVGIIPEVPVGAIMASAVMIIALVAYVAVPKWRRKQEYANL